MTATRCEQCFGPLPLLARSHARYCSGRCRTAACRARRTVPAELTSRARWVRYSAAKVPLTVAGKAASSTDVRTWSDYATAKRSTVGVGLGFVLNGDGIVCLDLDHCLHGGKPAPWAARLLERIPATYVEVSPSGDGLHVWGRSHVLRGRRGLGETGQIEVYGSGRYITVTGRRFGSAPAHLADIGEVIADLT